MSRVLASSYVSSLTDEESLQVVGAVALVAASQFSESHWKQAVLTIFALAQKHADTANRDNADPLRHQGFNLFSSSSVDYTVSEATKTSLLDFCLAKVDLRKEMAEVGVILRCIPFVTVLLFEGESQKARRESWWENMRLSIPQQKAASSTVFVTWSCTSTRNAKQITIPIACRNLRHCCGRRCRTVDAGTER